MGAGQLLNLICSDHAVNQKSPKTELQYKEVLIGKNIFPFPNFFFLFISSAGEITSFAF